MAPMKKFRICALAAVIVGVSTPLHAEEPYGSIALSQEAGGHYAWGIAWRVDSAQEAMAESLNQCQAYGGRDCQEIGQFREACGALVIGNENNYSIGWGAMRAMAVRDALTECRADDVRCRVEFVRCSQPPQAGGAGRAQDAGVSVPTAGEEGPATVMLDVKCPGQNELGQPLWFNCWTELSNQPGCYFWYLDATRWIGYPTHESASWSGSCRGGLADGEGVLTGTSNRNYRTSVAHAGNLLKGKKHGQWVETRPTDRGISREEGLYVHGLRDGVWIVDHWLKCESITYPVADWMDARDPC